MPLLKQFVYCLGLLFPTIVCFADSINANKAALLSHPSPYIRSHADDPIRWKLVTNKTIATSKRKNQPIIISSGYQACYWCYRMKMDTFSDAKLAKTINQSFLPLLIDRELEPQLDQQLQLFIEEQRGFGGWPLTVILTPQGYPVAGFSYIKPEPLNKALQQFLFQWEKNPNKVISLATTSAANLYNKQQNQTLKKINYRSLLQQFLKQVSATSDNKYGGFGDKEKFPNFPQLYALLDLYSLNPDKALSQFLQLTLDNMLAGAIHDQLGGGFFRYVENRDWQNPHYEQMLYTQALLGKLYIRAGQVLKRSDYILSGKNTLLNMVKTFKDKDSFYHASLSAFDEKNKAGGYYLWKPSELKKHIGKNWQDQIENLIDDNSSSQSMILPKLRNKTPQLLQKLLQERSKRHLLIDNKKLLAWQGLVLSGLAYGAQTSPELAHEAKLLAENITRLIDKQIMQKLITTNNHGVNTNHKKQNLDSMVYIAQGLVDWWQISADESSIKYARILLETSYQQFYKEGHWQQNNGYDFLKSPPTLAIADSQLPSPSAIWLSLGWALASLEKPQSNITPLTKMADNVAKNLPQALHDDAFFHATLLSILITKVTNDSKIARTLHLGNNR